MYPGWKAWVDRQPTPVLTADYTLRSIYLASGQHQVEFRFEPDWLHPLQIGLMLWIAVTLGLCIWKVKMLKKNA